MATKYLCDRCHLEVSDAGAIKNVTLNDHAKDLCASCFELFRDLVFKFLQAGSKQ